MPLRQFTPCNAGAIHRGHRAEHRETRVSICAAILIKFFNTSLCYSPATSGREMPSPPDVERYSIDAKPAR